MDHNRQVIHVPAFGDLINRIARFDSFQVAGRVYTAELLTPQILINSSALIAETSVCPSMILYWGLEAARARRFMADCDAAYRVWRDGAFIEAKATPVGSTGSGNDKFPTDAQAEAAMRQRPAYIEWHRRIADARTAAEHAEAVYEAFKAKRDLLQTQAKLLHDEAGGPYRVEEEAPRTVARTPQYP